MTDTKRFTDDLDKATILGAIARGWCHEENATKEMDGDLAGAIADEVEKVIATLRAELDAARGRVRPLVWGDRPDGLDYRIGRCGQISYCVRCENGQWGYSRHGDVGLTVSYKGLPLFTDEQDAINGAEVDHRARILAALEPDPAVVRMREALELAANRLHRCSVDYDTGTHEFIETGEWAAEARAAITAWENRK